MTVTTWPAAAVADPALRARARRHLTQPPRPGRPVRIRTLTGGLLAVLAAAAAGEWIPGRHGTALMASLLLVTFVVLSRGRIRLTASWYRRRYRGRVIQPSSLDRQSRCLLARAQRAIGDVYATRAFGDGIIDSQASSTILAAHEWDIARLLHDHSRLQAMRTIISAAAPTDPDIRAILAAQAEAGGQVLAAVARRVDLLESYAAEIRATDHRYRLWLAASAAADLNGPCMDLLAAAPIHAQIAGELEHLTTDARRVQDLAAGTASALPLVLPDPQRPGPPD